MDALSKKDLLDRINELRNKLAIRTAEVLFLKEEIARLKGENNEESLESIDDSDSSED